MYDYLKYDISDMYRNVGWPKTFLEHLSSFEIIPIMNHYSNSNNI